MLQQTEAAREYVRANSVSGVRARERIAVVEDRRPKIQLSLKYNNRTKTLSVVVHRIKNLVTFLSPASEASTEVANLTERKNPNTPEYFTST